MNSYDTIILDTNIFKYSSKRSRYFKHEHSREIFSQIISGAFRGLIPSVVLFEMYYQLADKMGEANAMGFLNHMVSMNNVDVVDIEEEHARFGGEIYFRYNYEIINGVNTLKDYQDRISAIDCLIIGIGNFVTDSVICTYDGNMQNVIEVEVKPPSDILGIL